MATWAVMEKGCRKGSLDCGPVAMSRGVLRRILHPPFWHEQLGKAAVEHGIVCSKVSCATVEERAAPVYKDGRLSGRCLGTASGAFRVEAQRHIAESWDKNAGVEASSAASTSPQFAESFTCTPVLIDFFCFFVICWCPHPTLPPDLPSTMKCISALVSLWIRPN